MFLFFISIKKLANNVTIFANQNKFIMKIFNLLYELFCITLYYIKKFLQQVVTFYLIVNLIIII